MIGEYKKRLSALAVALIMAFTFVLYAVPVSVCADNAAIRLNRSECTLNVGETMRLKASVLKKRLKDKKVVFQSNKPAVASVTQRGKVTAKKTGTARVTAYVKGTDYRASCKVSVKNSRDYEAAGSPVTILFPGDLRERDTYNAAVFDINAFSLSVVLPEGWTVDPDADVGNACPGTFSNTGIRNKKGQLAGIVGYNIYDRSQDDPRAVYSQIALGNHFQFDVRDSYKVIRSDAAGTVARCKVYRSALMTGGAESVNYGIVSCNKKLGVYIAMELFSGELSDSQVTDIAESIRVEKRD